MLSGSNSRVYGIGPFGWHEPSMLSRGVEFPYVRYRAVRAPHVVDVDGAKFPCARYRTIRMTQVLDVVGVKSPGVRCRTMRVTHVVDVAGSDVRMYGKGPLG